MRLHRGGGNPHQCDLCGKMLVRRRDLERHNQHCHGMDNCSDSSADEIDVVTW